MLDKRHVPPRDLSDEYAAVAFPHGRTLTLRVRGRALLPVWLIVAVGLVFGVVGVAHAYAYFAWHPGPSVPPWELVGFCAVGLVPELRRMNEYRISLDAGRVYAVDHDGERSCSRAMVVKMVIRSVYELSPRPRDPWILTMIGLNGTKLLEVRAAQRFGLSAVKRLAANVEVPLEIQPPLAPGKRTR